MALHGSTFISYSGATCILFDNKLNLFYITQLSRRRFYFVCSCLPFVWIFLAIRVIQVYLKGDEFLKEFAICYAIFLLVSLLFGGFFAITSYATDELRILASQLIKLFSAFQSKAIN